MPGSVDGAAFVRYRRALAGEPLPAAIVDLDAVEVNVDRLLAPARAAGKRVRIATKSLRCPALIGRVAARAGATVHGLMTYDARETAFWAATASPRLGSPQRERRRPPLRSRRPRLAYPTLQPCDVAALAEANRHARAAVVVDDDEQLSAARRRARAAGTRIPVVIDVDMSWRPVAALHVGVRRWPLRDAGEVVALARAIAAEAALAFDGIMGYEAQIAGLQDRRAARRLAEPAQARAQAPARVPRSRARAPPSSRRCARPRLAPRSSTAAAPARPTGPPATARSPRSRSAPASSCGHLFDHYAASRSTPALFFALQATRRPAPRIVTCHGGGWIASGAAAPIACRCRSLPPAPRCCRSRAPARCRRRSRFPRASTSRSASRSSSGPRSRASSPSTSRSIY